MNKQAETQGKSIYDKLSTYGIFYVIITFGIVLTSYQYYFNRSLWIDEASLALNIVSRSYAELFQPLDYFQAGPILFLLIEKVMIDVFGAHDYVLRLFPFCAYFMSLYLCYRLTMQITSDKCTSLFSTALFSITYSMIYYATEAKQYMLDIVFILLLFDRLLSYRTNKKIKYVQLIALGALAMFTSTISVVALAAIVLYLIVEEWYINKNGRVRLILGAWLAFFMGNYILFVHAHPSKGIMLNHWQAKFLPLNPFDQQFYEFLVYAVGTLYSSILGFGSYWLVGLAISIYGIIRLIKERKYWPLYLLLVPAIVHLVLSGLRLYPFYGRFILYLAPLLMIVLSIGWLTMFRQVVEKYFGNTSEKFMAFAALPLLLLVPPLLNKYPIEKEEIKTVLDIVEAQRTSQDDLYIYYGAERAVLFYEFTSQYTNLKPMIIGRNGRKNLTQFDADITELSGSVWLVFSHVDNKLTKPKSEEDYIMAAIKKKGGQVEKRFLDVGSSAYLVVFD